VVVIGLEEGAVAGVWVVVVDRVGQEEEDLVVVVVVGLAVERGNGGW